MDGELVEALRPLKLANVTFVVCCQRFFSNYISQHAFVLRAVCALELKLQLKNLLVAHV